MNRHQRRALKAACGEVGDYHDADGFVYRDVPHEEAAQNGWRPLSEEQQKHVLPLPDGEATDGAP